MDNVRKLGLVPVYPPREDIQVGDVYVVWTAKTPSNKVDEIAKLSFNDDVSTYLGTLHNLVHAAEEYMAGRVVFRLTSNFDEDTSNNKTQPDLYDDAQAILRRNAKAVSSLPVTALPEISADAGFSTGLGIVEALRAVGLAGAARTQVILNFNDVRSYGVPPVEAAAIALPESVELYDKRRKVTVGGQPIFEPALIQARNKELMKLSQSERNSKITPVKDRCRKLRTVTKVYLTREITYTYRNARIVAAALKRAENTDEQAKAGSVASPTNVGIAVNVASGESDPSVSTADLNKVRDDLVNLVNSQNQGTALTFEGWDAIGMRFSQKFERPVIVAYESFDTTAPGGGRNACILER